MRALQKCLLAYGSHVSAIDGIFFNNNLMFTYEYIKISNMEKYSWDEIFIFIFP